MRRARRDDHACSLKYGADWKKFKVTRGRLLGVNGLAGDGPLRLRALAHLKGVGNVAEGEGLEAGSLVMKFKSGRAY
eukprot:763139-Hanusia_phi.AAC.5